MDIKEALQFFKNEYEFLTSQGAIWKPAIQHAIDIMQEIEDGKWVKLPCKVGDTVYAIVHCEDIVMHCDDDYYNGTGAKECPFENTCEFEECTDENERIVETICSGFYRDICDELKLFFDNIGADVGVNDFGKTVFLTRKEAEKALKAKGGSKS